MSPSLDPTVDRIGPFAKTASFLEKYGTHFNGGEPSDGRTAADLVQSVSRMRVETYPFPYGLIDDFLPADIFDAVMRDWPSESSLEAVPLPTSSGYLGSRKARLIDDRDSDGIKTTTEGTWESVASALRDPVLVHALFSRFSDVVENNLSEAVDEPEVNPGFRLYQCVDKGQDEALGAHVDSLRKLLTIVLYVQIEGEVDADSERLWGTSLYDVTPGSVAPVTFSRNSDYRPAASVKFVSNRAFVMPNNSRAHHGVAGGQASVLRRTLMCGYWALDRAR